MGRLLCVARACTPTSPAAPKSITPLRGARSADDLGRRIGTLNGQPLEDASPYDVFRELIEDALAPKARE